MRNSRPNLLQSYAFPLRCNRALLSHAAISFDSWKAIMCGRKEIQNANNKSSYATFSVFKKILNLLTDYLLFAILFLIRQRLNTFECFCATDDSKKQTRINKITICKVPVSEKLFPLPQNVSFCGIMTTDWRQIDCWFVTLFWGLKNADVDTDLECSWFVNLVWQIANILNICWKVHLGTKKTTILRINLKSTLSCLNISSQSCHSLKRSKTKIIYPHCLAKDLIHSSLNYKCLKYLQVISKQETSLSCATI